MDNLNGIVMDNSNEGKSDLSIEEKRAFLKQLLADKGALPKTSGTPSDGQQVSSIIEEALPQLTPNPDARFLPFPLTEIQLAYLLGREDNFSLGGVSSHGYVEVDCPYDEAQLSLFNQALQKLIKRHDMLRAVMMPDVRQRVLEQVPPYVISSTDLSGQSEETVQATLARIREEMSHQVLDIYSWPIFDIRATRIGKQRIRFHVSFDVLLMDGWSVFLLYKEFYHFVHNPEAVLPPLELTFRDYVVDEEKLRERERYKQSMDYWLRRLDDLPPAPELPLAVAPEILGKPRFTRRSYTLPADAWFRLRNLGARNNLTASALVCAVFAEVLALWSNSSHFIVNLTLFKRLSLHPQVNDIVGDFTSTLLLEIDSVSEGTFRDRAKRIQQQLWEDMRHNAVSGVQVLRELARRRRGAQVAMPVVLTSTLGLGSSEEELPPSDWLGEVVYAISQTPQVWLDHQVFEYNGELIFNWDCIDEPFPPGLLDEMFAAHCRLLELLATDESAWRWASFHESLLAEQLAGRAMVNDTAGSVSPTLLHDLFVREAQRRPDALAVISSVRTLSYGELLDLAKRTAHWLQRNNVVPNTLVAVVMEKCWEQVAAVLGILMAGGAYLPIDAHLPAARRNDLMTDGGVRLALTQSQFSVLEWPDGIKHLIFSEENFAREEASVAGTTTSSEDLAYVIYTSGSTGRPKGVMIDHRGAVNTILDINRRFSVTEEDRVFCLSALNFDLSVYDVFGVLAVGGVLVIPEEKGLREPAHWRALMTAYGVTLWNTVPALKQMLVEYLESRAEPAPPGMRLVMMSGDWIPLDLPGRIRALWPEVEIIGLGGATEASIWSNFYSIEEFDPNWKSIPYGKPLTNQSFQVLDGNLQPRPVWVPGDLYIGGIGLAKGYWNDPAKTTERFIVHPDTHERLYRTGDLGRYLPDGNLEFLGRSDFQVKIRGHRIELGEIEAVLTSHPGVKEAVVTAVGEERNLQAIAAYVVPLEAGQLGDGIAEELKAHVGTGLPGYMVPATFTVLDALPLTSSGKIDRRALPTQNTEDRAPTTAYVPPRTEPEIKMAGLWSEVLGVDKIGLHDDFFDLGGHSLFAVQLASRVKEYFGFDMPLRTLFEAPTVSDLLEKTAGIQTPDGAEEKLDLEAEARLDDDIRPQKKKIAASRIENPRNVFITGATGFLGVYLIGELLRQTQATIWCLVRGKDEQEAEKRLTVALMAHAQVTGRWRDRVKVIMGDLKQKWLGLAEAVFLELARKIDVIYHNGAVVNHLYSYRELRRANVYGTKEVLRLACIERTKSVHYVSTIGVFFGATAHAREDSKLDADGLDENGYVQSKWVSEKLVWEASNRGLPVAVYRPARFGGHSKTGKWNDSDVLYRMLKATISKGISPDWGHTEDIVPVDYCVKALIWLSRRKQNLGSAYHFVNPNLITWREIVDRLRANGFHVVDRPFKEWHDAIRRSEEDLLGRWLDYMVEYFPETGIPIFEMPIFESEQTIQALSGSGIECPRITTELIGHYVASMQQEK